ncbi:MBL fold metallo-hydrolase [Salmonella enterica]|nr:MBL fold metallo-hydrolase [Salmonella enterica]
MFTSHRPSSTRAASAANLDRRRFLGVAASLAGAGALGMGAMKNVLARQAGTSGVDLSRGTQLVLLGTKGGPRVGGTRSNPANVLMIDGEPHVVDCGYGAASQLVKAGVPLPSISKLFITHMHSDHNLDYGPLLYSAWSAGLKHQVDVWAPPTLDAMTRAFWAYMDFDIGIRMADEGKPDLRKLVVTHEFADDGVLLHNSKVKVTATRTIHPPIHDSFALRFDTQDRSIVFSGDTAYCPAVAELARGADVLVHEVIYVPAIDALTRRVSNAATLREHLLASHTAAEDVGRIAAAANVKKLVLSHIVPGDDPGITDEMLLAGVRKHFKGEAVVGQDLMVL